MQAYRSTAPASSPSRRCRRAETAATASSPAMKSKTRTTELRSWSRSRTRQSRRQPRHRRPLSLHAGRFRRHRSDGAGYGGEIQITDAMQAGRQLRACTPTASRASASTPAGPLALLKASIASGCSARHSAGAAPIPARPRTAGGLGAHPRRWAARYPIVRSTTTTGPAPPRFFDYDAIVVEPAGDVEDDQRGRHARRRNATTYDEEASRERPDHRQRHRPGRSPAPPRDETERLLARGGLVVVFAYPDVAHPTSPASPARTVTTGCRRLRAWTTPPYVKPAGGTEVKAAGLRAPLRRLLRIARQQRPVPRPVHASRTQRQGHRPQPGGAAIAIELQVGGGRVIFLPALPAAPRTRRTRHVATTIVTPCADRPAPRRRGPSRPGCRR